jgi:outer membrane lipoprotein SlyB
VPAQNARRRSGSNPVAGRGKRIMRMDMYTGILPTVALGTALLLAAGVSGCASSRAGNVYSRDEARTAQTVTWGTVQAVNAVQIEGTRSHVGTATGAVLGGLAGSTVGGGTGRKAATVGGAVAGGVAGAAAEQGLTRKAGVEVTVALDNGNTVAVVQEAVPEQQFYVGQRVRVLAGGGTFRVSP